MKFKNFGKIACMGVVMAVAGTFGLSGVDAKTTSVLAKTASSTNMGETISIQSYKTNYTVDDIKVNNTDGSPYKGNKYVVLPDATTSGGTVSVTATNSVGKKADVYQLDGHNCLDLSSDKGVYYITYSVTTNGVTTATKELRIAIDTIVPTYDWDQNTKQIIPAKVNAGSTIVFPYPSIIDESAESEDGETVYVKHNGNDLTDDYFATLDDAATKDAGLTVVLTDPQKGEITLTKNGTDANAGKGYYSVNITDDFSTGKYTLTYTYSSENAYTIKKTYTFEVVTKEYFDQVEDVTLKISALSSAMPTSMELNVETQLPYPTVTNTETNEEVSVYTVITVTCTPSDGGEVVSWNSEDNPELFEDFKFKPTIAGNYNISYTVRDFAGNTASAEYRTIRNVKKGTTGSEVYVVESYTTNLEAIKGLTSEEVDDAFKNGTLVAADYAIPTKIATGTQVTFPAIYGIDLTDSFDDLTFSRIITNRTTGTSYTYSATSTDNTRKVDPDQSFTFTFEEAGTYTVRYQMRDSTSTNSTIYYDPFTITVEDNYEDTKAPEVTLLNVANNVTAGSETSFSVRAIDYENDEDDTIADANLKIVVQYQFSDGDLTTLFADDEGNYTIKIPETQTGSITVKATATDDANQSFTATKTIQIKNYSSDTSAPTISADFDFGEDWFTDGGSGSDFKVFTKGDEVTLPTVTFSDGSDNLVVTAYVDHVETGSNLAVFNGLSGTGSTVSFGGEKINLTNAGTYVVTYIAQDPAGNMAVKSFQFTASTNAAPTISGLGNINGTAEWGDEIDLVSPITVYNDTDVVNYDIVYVPNSTTDIATFLRDEVQNGSLVIQVTGNYIALPDNKIQAREGTITVNYWAKSENGLYNENPQTKTITAEDTTAPTFYVDESLLPDTMEFNSEADNETDKSNWIYIPSIENVVDNGSGVDFDSLSIIAQYSSSTQNLEIHDIPADDAEHAGYYGYIIATKNGTINITYSISDRRQNISEETVLSIAVGDVTPPEMSLDDLNIENSYNIGDILSIKLGDIKVTDDSDVQDDPSTDEDESENNVESEKITVTLTCDGSTVSKADSSIDKVQYDFKIEKAGSYVLTFRITDDAGNTTTRTLEFTVSEPSSAPVISTAVWGTVLIIVSLLILGGVIYFFIKPSKTKVKDTKTKSTKNEEKDKE